MRSAVGCLLSLALIAATGCVTGSTGGTSTGGGTSVGTVAATATGSTAVSVASATAGSTGAAVTTTSGTSTGTGATSGAGSTSGAPLDAGPSPLTVTLSTTPLATIHDALFGVNYDWNDIDTVTFPSYTAFMAGTAHYTLARFPGGFNAEHYDWATNSEAGWSKWDNDAGETPTAFLAAVPQAAFTGPSAAAVADAGAVSGVTQALVSLVQTYAKDGGVKIWEIGNEPWNQGGTYPATLDNYAALVASAAPAMKSADPSIEVYATWYWQSLSDFSTLVTLVGPTAWASVDGIVIHSYCGVDADAGPLCSSLPTQVAAIKAATGKSKIFASEWAVTYEDSSAENLGNGIYNASQLAFALQTMALAGITAATYWPDAYQEEHHIALASPGLAAPHFDGLLFGWMSQSYRGQALATGGDLPAIASLTSDGGINVILPTQGIGPQTVQISLAGTTLTTVQAADVIYSPDAGPLDPDSGVPSGVFDPDAIPATAVLPTTLTTDSDGGLLVTFEVNPGTPNRGSNWEIVRVQLH